MAPSVVSSSTFWKRSATSLSRSFTRAMPSLAGSMASEKGAHPDSKKSWYSSASPTAKVDASKISCGASTTKRISSWIASTLTSFQLVTGSAVFFGNSFCISFGSDFGLMSSIKAGSASKVSITVVSLATGASFIIASGNSTIVGLDVAAASFATASVNTTVAGLGAASFIVVSVKAAVVGLDAEAAAFCTATSGDTTVIGMDGAAASSKAASMNTTVVGLDAAAALCTAASINTTVVGLDGEADSSKAASVNTTVVGLDAAAGLSIDAFVNTTAVGLHAAAASLMAASALRRDCATTSSKVSARGDSSIKVIF
mmetsp:Transcript_22611/g.37401  ORF Transcript_22611/g.37401 Transcript_22611/m.37401 type:complete len:314 (-) Transcript_22611:14-955(-)